MSYSRHSHSDWYIWWDATYSDLEGGRADQGLVCWGPASRGGINEDVQMYPQVKSMLALGDFSAVVGYEDKYKDHLRDCFERFVVDVEEEYSETLEGSH